MSKERLEEIKRITSVYQKHALPVELNENNVNWLIQQAEQKIQLEQRVEKLEDELYELNESALETQNDFLDTNGEKNRLLEQNQHYKQALEHVIGELKYVLSTPDTHNRDNVIKCTIKDINKALKGDTNA